MNDDLKAMLGALRLPRLAAHWDDDLKEAARQRMSQATLLTHVIEQGATGRYVLFADLVAQLYQSVAVHTQEQVLKKYGRWDVLLIDEIGYVEVEPVQVGLFFTLMQKRHRKKSTLLTSNLGFSEWGAFLKNDHLTAALIDRLTEASQVINMKQCVSLRTKLAPEP